MEILQQTEAKILGQRDRVSIQRAAMVSFSYEQPRRDKAVCSSMTRLHGNKKNVKLSKSRWFSYPFLLSEKSTDTRRSG